MDQEYWNWDIGNANNSNKPPPPVTTSSWIVCKTNSTYPKHDGRGEMNSGWSYAQVVDLMQAGSKKILYTQE